MSERILRGRDNRLMLEVPSRYFRSLRKWGWYTMVMRHRGDSCFLFQDLKCRVRKVQRECAQILSRFMNLLHMFSLGIPSIHGVLGHVER